MARSTAHVSALCSLLLCTGAQWGCSVPSTTGNGSTPPAFCPGMTKSAIVHRPDSAALSQRSWRRYKPDLRVKSTKTRHACGLPGIYGLNLAQTRNRGAARSTMPAIQKWPPLQQPEPGHNTKIYRQSVIESLSQQKNPSCWLSSGLL